MIEKEILRRNPMERKIVDDEFEITFSRASGPGGQNVNRRATKATLFWNVWESRALSQEEKQKIVKAYPNRIDKEGNFIIWSQSERSQFQNRRDVIEKLERLVSQALKPEKVRRPTKIPGRAKEKRLKEKKMRSEKKRLRQKP